MDEEEGEPIKYTLKYIKTLPIEDREAAHAIRREQLRISSLESAKAYQKRNRAKLTAYQREWRRKKKEDKILEEAKRIENERAKSSK